MFNAYIDGKKYSTRILWKGHGHQKKTRRSFNLSRSMDPKTGAWFQVFFQAELENNAESAGIIILILKLNEGNGLKKKMKSSYAHIENMETNGQKSQNICLDEQTITSKITSTQRLNASLRWKKNQISTSIFNQEFSQLLERIFPSEILILVNCRVSLTNLKALMNQFGFEF